MHKGNKMLVSNAGLSTFKVPEDTLYAITVQSAAVLVCDTTTTDMIYVSSEYPRARLRD
jgi:hypothetical protein